MGTLCISSRTVCLSLSGQKMEIVSMLKGTGAEINTMAKNGCHFVSYLGYIIGAKIGVVSLQYYLRYS